MFNIVGAGMAGLVAGCVLNHHGKLGLVMEKAESLPNNHTALLRFRQPIVGDYLGIPFRRVRVMKGVHSSFSNKVAQSLSYSMKTTGTATLRSVLTAQEKVEERYIAPNNFIDRMAEQIVNNLRFGEDCTEFLQTRDSYLNPTISTIPMPALANILGYEFKEEFRSAKGWTLRAKLRNVDVCATLYFPDNGELFYRASITDNTLIIEYANPFEDNDIDRCLKQIIDHPMDQQKQIHQALMAFGLGVNLVSGKPEIKESQYAKILPIDEHARRKFLMWATDEFGIYSLGRFATWRPGLMTDDLIQDIQIIEKMANKTDYEKRK